MTSRIALLFLLSGAGFAPALAADTTDTRAAELARLRREVETLSAELSQAKEDTRARLRAIDAQKLDIEVSVRREDLRLSQVQSEMGARRDELAQSVTRGDELGPALRQAIEQVRATVEGGLPFHRDERLAELTSLQQQIEAGLLTPEAGVARLWAFTEDELRLTRESGLDRQIISLDGREVLAEVARLGMVALYFRTDGGEVGMAVREGGGWGWHTVADRDQQLAISGLFDTFKHGVRSGTFQLPNPAIGARP
jgi:Protein of unknown function (DUF3450)